MKNLLTHIIVIASLLVGPLAAAESLSLDDARRLARSNTQTVLQAEANLDAAESAIAQAWSLIIPRISASASGTIFDREIIIDMPEFQGVDLGIEDPILQHDSSARVGVQLQTQLFDPTLFQVLPGARAGVVAQEHGLEATRDAVELAVVELFFRIEATSRLVETDQERLQISADLLAAVAAELEAGATTELQLIQAETDLLEAEIAHEDLIRARQAQLRALASLLGLPEGSFELGASDLPTATDSHVEGGIDGLSRVLAAEQAVAVARYRYGALGLGYLPHLVLDSELNWMSEEAVDGERTDWRITFALQWSIFDGGVRRAQRREAAAQIDRAEFALEQERRERALEVEEARDSLDSAKRSRDLANQRERLATAARNQAAQAVDEQVGSRTQVLRSDEALVWARIGVERAELEVALANLRLLAATGDL